MNDDIKEILDFKEDADYKKLSCDEIAILKDYITNLENKIDKAIEYIENTPLYETTYDYNMEEELEIQNVSDETASNKLLNILRGEDK